MAIVHNLLLGVGTVLLDAFAGPPTAPVTFTSWPINPLAGDFGRVASDLTKAMRKVGEAEQLEFEAFAAPETLKKPT